jgi:glucose-6-phosphate-specific signal transduction histidine kinase
MQERVSVLGGKIEIQSRIGFGTHIRIEVPYPKGSAENEKDTGSDR